MYQVLYRKYRPKVFSDVVGQPQVTNVLAGEVSAGRLSHAYLFTGSRGTGKTTCARIFAKAVCCRNPQNGNPCGECDLCRGIDDGSIMDYSELDAASNRSIEDIRRIREEAVTSPQSAKYRIFVLDEVHMLTNEAFNALLKILEEPPEHVIFILATTDVQKLPSTVLSRCQRFDFTRIDSEIICKSLIDIAEKEGKTLTRDGAALIAGMADGAMRDSLSILDRCMSEDGIIDSSAVSSVAGLVGRDSLFKLSDAVACGDVSTAVKLVADFHHASCDSERLCSDLLEHFRCYMIVKTVKRPDEILVCTREELEKFKQRASEIPIEKILHYIDILSETVDKLKKSSNGRVDAEMAVIRLCTPSLSESRNALLSRIAQLEEELDELKKNGVKNISAANAQGGIFSADGANRLLNSNTVYTDNADGGKEDEPPFDIDDNTTAFDEKSPLVPENIGHGNSVGLPKNAAEQTVNELLPFDTEESDDDPTDLPFNTDESDDDPMDLPFEAEESDDDPTDLPFNTDESDDDPTDLPFNTDESDDDPTDLPFNMDESDDDPMDLPFNDSDAPPENGDGLYDEYSLPFDDSYVPPENYGAPLNNGGYENVSANSFENNGVFSTGGDDQKVSLNGSVCADWKDICADAKQISPPLNGLLDGSSAIENGNTLILSSVNPLFKSIVAKSEHMTEVIKKSVKKIKGRDFNIKFV